MVKKTSLGVIIAAAGVLAAGGARADFATAYGPICDSGAYIKSLTYYFCSSSNSLHEAMDICMGNPCSNCNVGIHAPLNGTRYYRWAGGCADDCNSTPTSCNGGAGNYYTVTGQDGFDFRMLHLNNGASTQTQYASTGTRIGPMGSTGSSTAPHVHIDNRRYGERLRAWYNGTNGVNKNCGDRASCSNVIGNPQMHAH